MDFIRDYTGDYYRVMKADGGSLDYSSHEGDGVVEPRGIEVSGGRFRGRFRV